jgi:hypothetical protein
MNLRQIFLCVSVGLILAACQGATGQSAQTKNDVVQAQAPSAAEQVQAALAQTQLSQVNHPLSDEEIQTAIASTQSVVTPVPLINQQVAMAIVKTQQAVDVVALSDAQIQTAIAQAQVEAASQELSPDAIQAALAETEMALAPQIPPLQDAATPTPEMLQVQGASMDDFSRAYIYSHGPVSGHKYFFTIQMGAEIRGTYHAKIGDTDYKCQILTAKPDRLYCQGPSVKGGNRTIKIYEDGTESLVFTYDFIFPEWTPTRPAAATQCPYKNPCPPCPVGSCGCCGIN